MPFLDLRAYIEKLEAEGELIRVSAEVDPHLEIGAITRRACERRARAPLFENIKNYPGHRMAGVLMGALGLDKATPPLDMIEYDDRDP